MHFYKRWNNITGWAVFAVAAMVYLMTMEPVSSLWDCSEFIATSYKLEVGHPPGAPLFMMLARLATLFAFGNPDYVGIAVNAMNSHGPSWAPEPSGPWPTPSPTRSGSRPSRARSTRSRRCSRRWSCG